MRNIREVLLEMSQQNKDVVIFLDPDERDFLKGMDEKKFELWTRQLGIEMGSVEYGELSKLVEKLKAQD